MLPTLIWRSATLCGIWVSIATCAQADERDYYDLGGFHHEVTTSSPAAQTWFDRGLAMCFGFNHEEAVRCFQKAWAEDPSLAIALWGMAYAWGPNFNNMEIANDQMVQADQAIKMAQLLRGRASPVERELIDALAKRYASPVPDVTDRDPLNRAYAESMRTVYERYPHDSLVATMFAESLMNLQPWKHWSPDGEPAVETPEIGRVLEKSLDQWPDYPGLCHLYIHFIEASPHPEKGMDAANALRDTMPGAGHLVHMPSHIDVLVGDYDRVIEANMMAIEADHDFLAREGAHNFYTLYRVHNYHFLVYGAMFQGQSELALDTARELVDQIPEDMLRTQTDFLDAFIPTTLHVMVRFGRWEEILAEPEPADYLPMSRSIRHYARAIAYASIGKVDDAAREQEQFEAVRATVPETSFLFNNSSLSILGVAASMMAGEIEYRRGNLELAFDHLREAVRRDDAMNYDEPWGWMQPARHALGALLLEQDQATKAEAVFRDDLRRHPINPWALHGLAESLTRQGKTAEAAVIRKRFQLASKRADVKIDRSCYCRLNGESSD